MKTLFGSSTGPIATVGYLLASWLAMPSVCGDSVGLCQPGQPFSGPRDQLHLHGLASHERAARRSGADLQRVQEPVRLVEDQRRRTAVDNA